MENSEKVKHSVCWFPKAKNRENGGSTIFKKIKVDNFLEFMKGTNSQIRKGQWIGIGQWKEIHSWTHCSINDIWLCNTKDKDLKYNERKDRLDIKECSLCQQLAFQKQQWQ